MNTENNYGRLFSQIRIEKNLSLTDLAEDGLSRSLIGRFEKGQTKISADRFFRLLSKIQVTPDEFLFRQKNGQLPDYFRRLAERMQDGDGDSKNLAENRQLEKEVARDYAADPSNLAAKYLGILLHFINQSSDDVNSGQDDPEKIHKTFAEFKQASHEILKYLFNVEIWGKFEVYLYIGFSTAFDAQTRMLLLKSALRSSDYFRNLSGQNDFADQDYKIILSVISSQIYDDLPTTKILLDTLKERLDLRPDIRFRAEYLFQLSLYEIAIGQEAKGQARAENVIRLWRLLEDEDEAATLSYFLQRFKKYLVKERQGIASELDRSIRLML